MEGLAKSVRAMTQAEVARALKISRQGVDFLERNALRKLRKSGKMFALYRLALVLRGSAPRKSKGIKEE